MRKIMGELCALLLEQKNVLEGLLELSRAEREIIVKGEAENLEAIVRQELRELSKLGGIERKRAALHREIAAEFGLPERDITVTAIAERARQDEREAIVKLQKELTILIGEHASLNKENRDLIGAHLEYTETMLELMVGSEDPLNNFYSGDGKSAPEKRKSTGFFDGHA